MGHFKSTYIGLDDFKVSCTWGSPYEGFVIGCGYAYVEDYPIEINIVNDFGQVNLHVPENITVQQLDTSLLAIVKSLNLTTDDIFHKLISEQGEMFVIYEQEISLKLPKKHSNISIVLDESDNYYSIKIEAQNTLTGEKYYYDYLFCNNNNDPSLIKLVKTIGSEHTNFLIDNFINGSNGIHGWIDNFAEGLTKTGKTRISNKNLKLYFEKSSGYVFYGNQYVKTHSLVRIGKNIGKVVKPIGYTLNAFEIGYATIQDKGFGDNTKNAITKISGGMVGGAIGVSLGSKIGMCLGAAVVGLLTGGVGTGAGVAIGGFLGGVLGGYFGSELGEDVFINVSNSW